MIACDLAIAAEDAKFGLSEINWGIIPAGGVTKAVASVIGQRDTLYYIMTGEPFDGRKAAAMGLVNEAVPRAQLRERTRALAMVLLEKNAMAMRMAKHAARRVRDMSWEDAEDYLFAKIDQLRFNDPEKGREKGMQQFLDDKILPARACRLSPRKLSAASVARHAVPLARLLRPRSVAIVGVSPEPGSIGANVLGNLTRFGFAGDIHLVSRSSREIDGRRCVSSIDELPDGVDAAVLAVPRQATVEAVTACVRRQVGGALVFASGFAEMDETGRAEQEAMTKVARDGGLALCGPNCIGFVNVAGNVALTFEPLDRLGGKSRRRHRRRDAKRRDGVNAAARLAGEGRRHFLRGLDRQ